MDPLYRATDVEFCRRQRFRYRIEFLNFKYTIARHNISG